MILTAPPALSDRRLCAALVAALLVSAVSGLPTRAAAQAPEPGATPGTTLDAGDATLGENALELLLHADRAFQDGDLDRAATLYEVLARLFPDIPQFERRLQLCRQERPGASSPSRVAPLNPSLPLLRAKVAAGDTVGAVPYAVEVLEQTGDSEDATTTLDRAEDALLEAARDGSLELADFESYAGLVGASAATGPRLAPLRQRLVHDLGAAARSAHAGGDRREAHRLGRLAVEVSPEDPAAAELERSLWPDPGQTLQTETDGKLMVWVPAGRFRMGYTQGDDQAHSDEYPAHYVTVDGFWMDVTEVTNTEYRGCVQAGACTPPRKTSAFEDPDEADHPVRHVSFEQAKAYASWAGKRLPSEAEFEYAARAGVDTAPYPWGWTMSRRHANSMGPLPSAKPVGSYPANQWGLHDLLGNVAEWCEDRYHPSYENAPSTADAWTTLGERRVIRGGSFRDPAAQLRASRRDALDPEDTSGAVGFRCVLDED